MSHAKNEAKKCKPSCCCRGQYVKAWHQRDRAKKEIKEYLTKAS